MMSLKNSVSNHSSGIGGKFRTHCLVRRLYCCTRVTICRPRGEAGVASCGKSSFDADASTMRIVRRRTGVEVWARTWSAQYPCSENKERDMPSTGCSGIAHPPGVHRVGCTTWSFRRILSYFQLRYSFWDVFLPATPIIV